MLRRSLDAEIHAPGRQEIPLPGHRHLQRSFHREIPAAQALRRGVTQSEHRVEQASGSAVVESHVTRALEIVESIDAITCDRRPSEGTEAETVVEFLDDAVHETAAIRHRARSEEHTSE